MSLRFTDLWLVQSTVVPEFLLETLDKVTQHPAGGAVISIGVPTYREVRATRTRNPETFKP